MAINKIELYAARIPRKNPFRTSRGVQTKVNGVFLFVQDGSGMIGYGEAPPRSHINGETLTSAMADLTRISEEVNGMDATAAREYVCSDSVIGPSAQIGMEMALLDIIGQQHQKPICDIIGNARDEVGYWGLVNSDLCGDALTSKLHKMIKRGYDQIRIKVGEVEYEPEIERLHLARNVCGDTVKLWVDANQAWDLDHARKYLDTLAEVGIVMIEQPLDADNYEGHGILQKETDIPIMIDEGVQSEADLDYVIETNCAKAVNLKLLKLGTTSETARLLRKAKDAGFATYAGGTAVTDLFAAFARHMEFGLPDLDYFSTGVPRGSNFVDNPVTPGLRFDGKGTYALPPTKPGLGVVLKKDVLLHHVIDKKVIGHE